MIEVGQRVQERGDGRWGEVVEIDWPFGAPEESPFAEPHYSVLFEGMPWPEPVGERALDVE